MISKNENAVRVLFKISLENAGMLNAVTDIDDLLRGTHKFCEFFPTDKVFTDFTDRFSYTAEAMFKIFQWDDFDICFIIPDRNDILSEYYSKLRHTVLLQ